MRIAQGPVLRRRADTVRYRVADELYPQLRLRRLKQTPGERQPGESEAERGYLGSLPDGYLVITLLDIGDHKGFCSLKQRFLLRIPVNRHGQARVVGISLRVGNLNAYASVEIPAERKAGIRPFQAIALFSVKRPAADRYIVKIRVRQDGLFILHRTGASGHFRLCAPGLRCLTGPGGISASGAAGKRRCCKNKCQQPFYAAGEKLFFHVESPIMCYYGNSITYPGISCDVNGAQIACRIFVHIDILPYRRCSRNQGKSVSTLTWRYNYITS